MPTTSSVSESWHVFLAKFIVIKNALLCISRKLRWSISDAILCICSPGVLYGNYILTHDTPGPGLQYGKCVSHQRGRRGGASSNKYKSIDVIM